MNGDRLGNALDRWWVTAEQKQFLYGTVGRVNPDNTVTIVVPQRPDFVYVVMTDSTLAQARNQRRVPLRSGLPVKMRRENGTLVILEEDRTGLLENDPNAPGTVYSVNGQTGDVLLDFIDLTDVPTAYTGHANKVVAVKVAEDGLEFITNASDVAAAIVAAADKATPVDADLFALVDSAASNVLAKLTWANLKATLKVYLDTLYLIVAGKAGGQTASGGIAASENLVFDSTVHATKGVIGLQPAGGHVGIGTSTPGVDVVGTTDITAAPILQLSGATPRLVVHGSASAGVHLLDTGATTDLKWLRVLTDGGLTKFASLNDAATTRVDNILVLDHNLGQVGINTATLATGAAMTVGGDLATAVLRAVDAAGLGIEDDGGVVALFVQDGGNLGVRTTDIEATAANYATVQLGGLPAIIYRSDNGDDFNIANNAYYDGTWKRRIGGKASKISMASGLTSFSVTASGTADSAITWTDVLKFADDAEVGIGAPSTPEAKLHVSNGAYGGTPQASVVILAEDDADAGITIGTPNTNKGTLWFADNNASNVGALQYDHATDSMIFRVAGADVASFDSAGFDVVGAITGDTSVIIARATGTAVIRSTGVATTGIGSMQAFSDAVDLRFVAYGSAVAGSRGGQAFANAGEFVVASGDKFLITVVPNAPLHLLTNSAVRMTILGGGNVGIGETTPTGKLHVEQASITAAIPALWLRQADLSEEFIRFETTVAAGNPINTTALGTYYGRARVHVDGVGEKWIALYNT